MTRSFLILAAFLAFFVGLYPLHLFWISWFFPLPIFLIVFDPQCRWRNLLFLTLSFGVFVFAISLYWLLHYELRMYGLILMILAPTYMIYFFVCRIISNITSNSTLRIFSAVVVWLSLNFLVSLTPFGTGVWEMPFYGPLPFFETAAFVPYYGFTSLLIGLNAALALTIQKRNGQSVSWVVIFLVIIGGVYAWGNNRLATPLPAANENPPVKIALIQHNLPFSGLWRLKHADLIKSKYRELALKAAQEKPNLIIFPQYTFPDDALRQPQFFSALARETQAYLLLSSHIPRETGKPLSTTEFINTAILYSPDGRISGLYQTAERPPLRQGGEVTQRQYKTLNAPFGKIGILLCYEDVRPALSRKAAQQGARFLVALSNTGHFTTTYLPHYHLLQDQLRAIETGLPLLRVTPNGYSATIDSKGRLIKKSSLNTEEILFLSGTL